MNRSGYDESHHCRGRGRWEIARREWKHFESSPIAQLRAAAHVHYVAGNKSRFVGQQENTSIRNDGALRAVTEGMDFVQPTHRSRRISLLRTPLTQHRRP